MILLEVYKSFVISLSLTVSVSISLGVGVVVVVPWHIFEAVSFHCLPLLHTPG